MILYICTDQLNKSLTKQKQREQKQYWSKNRFSMNQHVLLFRTVLSTIQHNNREVLYHTELKFWQYSKFANFLSSLSTSDIKSC